MSAFDLIKHLQQSSISLGLVGDTLSATPKDALTDELRFVIRSNKSLLLEALSQPSAYWLIGGAIVVTSSPPFTLSEIQQAYPGQTCKPLAEPLCSDMANQNRIDADMLRNRVEALTGVFYDHEDVVFAIRWIYSGRNLADIGKLLDDAEKQVAARVLTSDRGQKLQHFEGRN
jgi:hypothetical protein